MQKFQTPAPVSALLDIPAGRIQLIAADRADTVVEVRPADASESRDKKAVEEIEVAYAGGVLRIEAAPAKNRLLGHSGSVEVTVRLPAGSRVEGKAGAAELRGVGRLGEVVFEGGHRQVRLDEAAGVRLSVHDADVAVGRLTGPAAISTQRGDIRIAEAAGGPVSLTTHKGDIEVTAAAGVSAILDAGTGHGRISNSLTNGAGTDVGLSIHATTSHGDITARSL
ncbi:DUF4097 family beta strand repeat-containing protein [Streptomyces sp. NPDC048324]|uniref:DUF4097 family beta strand repeat-containing protein n=1 Tax=Streptomyces sp. NPDC048324 TaxID=3157205 RepID=UPI003431E112